MVIISANHNLIGSKYGHEFNFTEFIPESTETERSRRLSDGHAL